MIEIGNKQVPTTLEELVDPKRTALILVDIQNDYCAPGGKYDQGGKDMSMYPTMIEKTAKLIEEAHQSGTLVVYIQNTNLADYRSDSVAYLRFKILIRNVEPEDLLKTEHAIEGTWGHQIVEHLAPRPNDLVIRKHRSSAFIDTRLDLILRSNNIQTVLITGVVTEGCVESTARDASFKDYIVVLVENCIGSGNHHLHEASMAVMRNRFDVTTSDEIIKVWHAERVALSSEPRRG
jgi:nicotinamidase-related amidase